MNNDSNNPNEPKRKRKPHTGDKKRFTPRPMGYKSRLNEKHNINNFIKHNLRLIRFSIYQGGILQVLLTNENQIKKVFISKRAIMKFLRHYFRQLEKPRKVVGKSVDSALSKLDLYKKIHSRPIYDNSIYGRLIVMGYRITMPMSDQTKRQIDIFNKIVNRYTI
jgi:hypothetical protein